jgi:hypothetical protein
VHCRNSRHSFGIAGLIKRTSRSWRQKTIIRLLQLAPADLRVSANSATVNAALTKIADSNHFGGVGAAVPE